MFSSTIKFSLFNIISTVFSLTPVQNINFKKSLITGPGLLDNSQLPYHYFYIHPFDKTTENLIESSVQNPKTGKPYNPDDLFRVEAEVTYSSGSKQKFQTVILSRGDGQYTAC